MINYCGVEPKFFDEICDGTQKFEERERRRPDKRLESVVVGEQIYIYEKRGKRAVLVKINAIQHIKEMTKSGISYYYVFYFSILKQITHNPYKHYQGWMRFPSIKSVMKEA